MVESPPLASKVLIKNQSGGANTQNGIYIVTDVGSAITNWVLTRATDYDTPSNINNTGIIPVENGSVNANTGWYNTTTMVVVDTTAITFIQFGNQGTVTSIATNNGITGGTITSTGTIGLAAITDGTLLANISGGSLYPSSTTLTALIDYAFGNAQGDILYRDSSAWKVLAPGTSGQLFQTGGVSANPAYTTAVYPTTTTINQILYSSAANTITGIAAVNSAVMISSAGGVPGFSTTLPSGLTIPGYQATITPAALTEVNDTNVTLSLGGTPATALLQATSITAGWTGTLSLARGGTNAALTAANGGIVYSTASALAITAAGSSGQLVQSAGAGAPGFTTATYPATAGATGKILISDGTNIISSTPTYPNAAGTIGNVITSDGTNFISSAAPSAGAAVQQVRTESAAEAAGTTDIPFDDTIPQNTEGDQYFSLAITPTNSSHILVIEFTGWGSYSGNDNITMALFQDSTANALAASGIENNGAGYKIPLTFRHVMTAGTTSATTFKIRIGGTTGGTFTLNGVASSRIYGGVSASGLMITEYTS